MSPPPSGLRLREGSWQPVAPEGWRRWGSPSFRRAGDLGKPAGCFSLSPGAGAGSTANCRGGFRGATLPADQRMPCATDPLRSRHVSAGPTLCHRLSGHRVGRVGSLMTPLCCLPSRRSRLEQSHLGGVEPWSAPRQPSCLPTPEGNLPLWRARGARLPGSEEESAPLNQPLRLGTARLVRWRFAGGLEMRFTQEDGFLMLPTYLTPQWREGRI